MDFKKNTLERKRSGQIKLETIDENSTARFNGVQHNIITKISSSSVGPEKGCENKKVTIETTVSWSKLPPLSPSHAVIEVVSDGTTSTEAGSESSDEKENASPENNRCLPLNTKSKLQRLGAMYSDNPENAVIQRTEDGYTLEEPRCEPATQKKPAGRSARLAALADTINHWEDDPRHFPMGKEAQGFFRSLSNQRLIYNYNENEKPTSPVKIPSPTQVPSPVKLTLPEKESPYLAKPVFPRPQSPPKSSPVRATSPVKGRYGSPIQMGIAMLKGTNNKAPSSSDEETSAPVMGVKQLRGWSRSQSALTNSSGVNPSRDASPTRQARDPAELPLAERMALFERNAGPAVLPKAPLALPVSYSKLRNKPSGIELKSTGYKSQQVSSGSLQDRLALFENVAHEKPVAKETLSERQQELEMLKQRWNRNKEDVKLEEEDVKLSVPPPPPPLPPPPEPFEFGRRRGSGYGYYSEEEQSVSEPVDAYPALKEVKKVRFSPKKPGCRYPNLSDEDMEDKAFEQENSDNSNRSSMSSSTKDTDMSSPEQDYAKLSKTNLKRDWSASESSGAEANDIDKFLDEALEISSDEISPPKRSSYSAIKPITPVRCVEINPSYLEDNLDRTDDEEVDREQVEQKIERLRQEVAKQQTYIHQASQALDLCYSTFEFSGSTELLEAEKLLLLASERRKALLQEMQRLRAEGRLHPGEPSLTERGSLTLSHVTLPLKMDVVHHAAKDDECYYLLCVVRHNEDVQCSDIMSARRSLHSGNRITFPNKFTVRDLCDDFSISVELYAMKARHKELIPHDIKYHINTNKKEVSKLRLTPRKAKTDPRPVAQSCSAGRTSAFTLAGHLVVSLRDIHRQQFTLSKSKHMYNNVVEGSVQLRLESEMQVDVEYRGFLTMFEDVSGLGAWHRRWCLLKGDKLSYWRYPDDERKKIPLDTIELSQCTLREVEVVRRDVCARPNTLQLFTVRPARHTDTESLVVTRRGDRTCVRHWLSADTREERDQWCHHLNKALTLMRAWGISTAL